MQTSTQIAISMITEIQILQSENDAMMKQADIDYANYEAKISQQAAEMAAMRTTLVQILSHIAGLEQYIARLKGQR